MSARFCRIVLFTSIILLQRVSHAAIWDLYSENLGTTREELVSSQTRVRVEPVPNANALAIPYFSGGYELMTAGLGQERLDSSSHAFGGVGVRVPLSFLQLRVETRFRAPLNDVPGYKPVDARAQLVYGDFVRLSEPDPVYAFLEPYGEVLFTTADSSNTIVNAYTRLGLRTPIEKASLDLMLEPFVALDTRGHSYNNRADLKLLARLTVPLAPLSFSLSLGHQWNQSFSVSEKNPYAGLNSGWRFMAVLGGLL